MVPPAARLRSAGRALRWGMGFWNVLRIDPTTGGGAAAMSNTARCWGIATLADAATSEALGVTSRS